MLKVVDRGGETAPLPARRVVLPVAPATAEQSNTLRPPLRAIAGFRLDDLRFNYGGSFLVSHAAEELSALRRLLDEHPGARIAVFGHDDRSRGAAGAWDLAGRRALSLLGVLLDRVDLWRELWTRPLGQDDWKRERAMLSMVDALSVARGEDAVPPRPAGMRDDAWFDALVRPYFELLRTCPETGMKLPVLGPDRLLFAPSRSLKGLAHSCSDLNPLRVLPDGALAGELDAPARLHTTSVNRRVHVYLFPSWMVLDLDRWPCPAVGGTRDACLHRLFRDEEARRAAGTTQRRHAQGDDTFGCRFYERITRGSPVEREGELRRTSHISVHLRSNSGAIPLAHRPCKLHLHEGLTLTATTDAAGALRVADVPAGEYLLEVDDATVYVTTLPPEVPSQTVRVPDYMTVDRS